MINSFFDKLILGKFIRFCIIGLINTAADFTIYISLTRGWDVWQRWYLLANLVAFIIANSLSFILNKSWAFKNQDYKSYHKQYLKFFIVSIGALAIVEATLFFFVDVLGVYDLVGKAVGIGLSIIWSFSIHHKWTFK